MTITEPAGLHHAVESAFNAADVEGLAALYEDDARMVGLDGAVAEGREAIRTVWEGLVALGGRMTVVTRYAVVSGDIALLRNDFTFAAEGIAISSGTAEVARRQPDGTWLYLVDHPFGCNVDVASPE